MFRPRYDLEQKALCYRHSLRAPVHLGGPERPTAQNDTLLVVTILQDRVRLHLEFHSSSGHAWWVDPHKPAVEAPIEDALPATLCAEIAALQQDPDAWAPEVLLEMFQAMPDRGLYAVEPGEADFFELGQSTSFDGTVPFLTLRLGRSHDEIVLDHSFGANDSERTIEVQRRLDPPGTPDALAAIAAAFGADMAGAAAHFHATRGARFG